MTFWIGFVFTVPVLVLHLALPEAARVSPLAALEADPEAIEALTVGSSHGRDIYYPAMGLTGHALSEDAGDINTADLKLRAAISRLPNLKYVFMPVSPVLLTYDRRIGDPGDWLVHRSWLRNTPMPGEGAAITTSERLTLWSTRLASLEPFIRVNEISKNAVTRLVRGALGGVDDKIDAQACHVIENPPDFPHEYGIRNGFQRTPLPADCIPRASEMNAWNHLHHADGSLTAKPEIRAENLVHLTRMAKAAREAGLQLIFFVPPVTQAYYETPELLRHWEIERPLIEELAEREGARFVDFHDFFWSGAYRTKNAVFVDGNHLTIHGAAVFSEALARELEIGSGADVFAETETESDLRN
ncbi:hypothetical protein [Litorisediminicola beolgyonensis]|uniref:AlgX/AlgJ SGNH hydrolase-like domain-containing protein n=1 Tax=Litorisediminicola beolgyonensis TaxID=1173614 RepID=A0ABW3ZLV6_9RHOB